MDELMARASQRDIWTSHNKGHVNAAIVKCAFCVRTIERCLGNGTRCTVVANNNDVGRVEVYGIE